jgi:GPH family glycoside/pentoside/hexuronide:cation symporter
MAQKQYLKIREKLGFGLGDTASNIVYQAVINILLYFYTDVYGITAFAAGWLLIVVRLFDAVTDPVMGAVADRTKSKYGRYRPWMLWVAIPYGILAVTAFITPNAGMGTKLVYAYISYALLMTAYTAVNIPYSALGGVMTADSQERAHLQTWRFAMAMVGGALVSAAIFPLAALLGGGSEAANYQIGFPLAMIVMAFVAVLCFLGCFALTKEHVKTYDEKPRISPLADLGAMFSNSQWLIIALATLFIMTRGAMQGAAKPYFVDYYLITDSLPAWLPAFMATKEALLSSFLTLTFFAGFFGAITAGFLVIRFCKVTVMRIALIGTITMNGLLFFISRDAVFTALSLVMLSNFCHMMFVPMLFSTVPDTVDFGLKTMGKGAMAMFCAGHLFVLKAGNAIGGGLTGFVLGWFGYVPNAEQSDLALTGILIAFAGSSVLAALLVIGCLQFYKLTRGWERRPEFFVPEGVTQA